MDARTTSKTTLPSRHGTEGPERAPHRSHDYAMGLTSAQIGSTNATLHLSAIAHECGVVFDLFDVAEVFKRTPYVADLKPGGRYVAKDLFEAGGVPLLMKTLLDHGHLHGDCTTVTDRTIAENLKGVKRNPDQDVVLPADKPLKLNVLLSEDELARRKAQWKPRDGEFASGYLWKYAQQVGSALTGAVTHPGGVVEKQCYADI